MKDSPTRGSLGTDEGTPGWEAICLGGTGMSWWWFFSPKRAQCDAGNVVCSKQMMRTTRTTSKPSVGFRFYFKRADGLSFPFK